MLSDTISCLKMVSKVVLLKGDSVNLTVLLLYINYEYKIEMTRL